MKKVGILNTQLSQVIAQMGHTDGLTICDAGLPIPLHQPCVDLALTAGVPDFLSTVNAVLSELFIEKIVLAEEIRLHNPQIEHALLTLIAQQQAIQQKAIEIAYLPHEQFKHQSNQAKAVVRTGECSPYANVIFYSGVPF